MSLARGEISKRITYDSIKEIKRLGFEVNELTDRIPNILDYELYVPPPATQCDNAELLLHVLDADTKRFLGTLQINLLPDHKLTLKLLQFDEQNYNSVLAQRQQIPVTAAPDVQ
uniref:Uncharacterized protein n=1 Tax=Lymantria dispar multicapsid nuclear polyhedrosis virus TaxID=10449 RepID=A0A1B1MQQ3_NPVLD|nr:hypothetical protein [Lymantria dispar multiple nucleopolyhedrovirus]